MLVQFWLFFFLSLLIAHLLSERLSVMYGVHCTRLSPSASTHIPHQLGWPASQTAGVNLFGADLATTAGHHFGRLPVNSAYFLT